MAMEYSKSFGATYENRNDRAHCICGAERTDIQNRIWYVGEFDTLVWSSYYYRCPECLSFSAVNLGFNPESYSETPIEGYCIPDVKRLLNKERVEWIRARMDLPPDPVIYDLGSGEGAFTEAFIRSFPEGRVHAVEADRRMPMKFTDEYRGAITEESYIEPFLAREEIKGRADVAALTDVLEHLVDPREMLDQIIAALKPGGCAYITVPNSRSLSEVRPVAAADVPWEQANRTCQHLWVMEPDAMLNLIASAGELIEYSRSLETRVRCDGQYSTFLLRRR